MKFFLQFFIAISSLSMILAISKEEAEFLAKKLAQKCKNSENASDADIETLVKEKVADTPESKCVVACLLGKTLITLRTKSKINVNYFRTIWSRCWK